MKGYSAIFYILVFVMLIGVTCKKPYNPPATQVNYQFLVIDGVLVNSPDSPTVIRLSRTVKLTDTTTASSPETGAAVSVEGSSGENFKLVETPGGIYQSAPLLLNTSSKYSLKITTSSGEDYASDFVEVRQTPPIDSLTWQQQNDVNVYLYTHDPANATKYYRWDYTET